MAVYCQVIYYGVLRCLYVNSDIKHVFLVPKKFDSRSKKCRFLTIFGSFPVKFSPKKFVWKNFIAPKDSSMNFRGILWSYFWAIVLIFAVMSIFKDFGSLLPAHPVAVKINVGIVDFDSIVSKSNEYKVIETQSRSMPDPPLSYIDFKNKIACVWTALKWSGSTN